MQDIVLILDAHFLLYRTLYSINFKKSIGAGERVFDSDESKALYMRVILRDIASQIRRFSKLNIKNVIVTDESHSWRYSIYPEYKTRTRDDKINFEAFSSMQTEIFDILAENGAVVSKSDGAEGDDLAMFWSKYFLANGISSIVVTGDRDLVELVASKNDAHVMIYNPVNDRQSLTMTEECLRQIKTYDNGSVEFDMFDEASLNLSAGLNEMQRLIDEIPTDTIDPFWVGLKKMILGDSSDTIPSAFKGFGAKTYAKFEDMVKDDLTILYPNKVPMAKLKEFAESEELVDDMISVKYKKIPTKPIDKDLIQRNLMRNWQLTALVAKAIPTEVKHAFAAHAMRLDLLHNSIETLALLTNKNALLENTPYDKTSSRKSALDDVIAEYEKDLNNGS